MTGEKGNVCKVLMGNPEGKRLVRRPKTRWEDNIEMNICEMWCDSEWICLAKVFRQVEGPCERDNQSSGFIMCRKIYEQLSDCYLLKDSFRRT
jgi:hypothetical protein